MPPECEVAHMKILMLGNSYTFTNDLPQMLASLTGAEVEHHTRGGARLAEQLNPKTGLGSRTLAALENEPWDYVVLQEMSSGPVTGKDSFFRNAGLLCSKICAAGAVPVIFATWAYKEGSKALDNIGLTYEEMTQSLSSACHQAAEAGHALVADVGLRFFEAEEREKLYTSDGSHPSEAGSLLAAKTIAAVIEEDRKKRQPYPLVEVSSEISENDPRLRILYMYRILQKYTDLDHPMTTNEIRRKMTEEHGITMHRTTVSSDIELLRAAGFEIFCKRSRANKYYLEGRKFELPELKVLIDAVESSKFITEKKSQMLVSKLISLTSDTNAVKLKRTLHTSGRVRSGNEKGYYIVDAINEAINAGRRISFYYMDYDGAKRPFLRNDGKPYTVSPYTLIWSGDYYYLVGYYHEKGRVNTFRVDRIFKRPEILEAAAAPVPADFDVALYTKEVFSMYTDQAPEEVTLVCSDEVMKGLLDQFGPDLEVERVDESHFCTTVKVCTSQTFYSWVFQWRGDVRIAGPESVLEEYRAMARAAAEA